MDPEEITRLVTEMQLSNSGTEDCLKLEETDFQIGNDRRSRFVRIRLCLNITNPIKKCIRIKPTRDADGIIVLLVYEKLPDFCYACGRVGHSLRECEDLTVDKSLPSFGTWLRAVSHTGWGKRSSTSEAKPKQPHNDEGSQSETNNYPNQDSRELAIVIHRMDSTTKVPPEQTDKGRNSLPTDINLIIPTDRMEFNPPPLSLVAGAVRSSPNIERSPSQKIHKTVDSDLVMDIDFAGSSSKHWKRRARDKGKENFLGSDSHSVSGNKRGLSSILGTAEKNHKSPSKKFRLNDGILNPEDNKTLLESEYRKVITRGWGATDSHRTLVDRLSICKLTLQTWAEVRVSFNPKKLKSKRIELNCLRTSEHWNSSNNKIRKLEGEVEKLSSQEELYWRQRSRISWLREGDRNSRFFHQKSSLRKVHNSIQGLISCHGDWCTEIMGMGNIVLDYFGRLFSSSSPNIADLDALVGIVEPTVDCTMNRILTGPFTPKEIHRALFDVNPDKARGLDGFSALFYQKFWDVIGDDVTAAALQIFNGEHRLIGGMRQ
ncbi:uncharacterized protein [Primulina eburnea]|uniref:uncharacterized protein n=1 Tax=Primulina eburnea TaxID=1245227 RepID=UPI003C6BF96C